MKLTQVELDVAVWGTGFGSRRHLIDHGGVVVAKAVDRADLIPARCSTGLLLDFIDTVHGERVARRKPCTRCYGIAATEGIPVDLDQERTP